MGQASGYVEHLESIHAISVEIAALRQLPAIYDRALAYCLDLTRSTMGFVDLVRDDGPAMDVVAVKGFQPSDPQLYERFRTMPIRPSVFGIVILEERPYLSDDVAHDPLRVGTPPGHPEVRTFLGVPLKVGDRMIGMIGVANKSGGYAWGDQRLLSTLANQVAVAIDNARLYERQQEMITGLQQLQRRLSAAERDQIVALERDRIAAGLHDEIEQQIFTIGLQLSSLLERGDLAPEAAEQIRVSRRLAARTAEQVRDVIFALAVDGHGGTDIEARLRHVCDDVRTTTGLDVDLIMTGEPTEAAARMQGTIHAIVKEALNNVVKHASATMALVTVRFERDTVDIVVQDDGVGAPAAVLRVGTDDRRHFALNNMRRQIASLGGTLTTDNGDEAGLSLRARLPLTAE